MCSPRSVEQNESWRCQVSSTSIVSAMKIRQIFVLWYLKFNEHPSHLISFKHGALESLSPADQACEYTLPCMRWLCSPIHQSVCMCDLRRYCTGARRHVGSWEIFEWPVILEGQTNADDTWRMLPDVQEGNCLRFLASDVYRCRYWCWREGPGQVHVATSRRSL